MERKQETIVSHCHHTRMRMIIGMCLHNAHCTYIWFIFNFWNICTYSGKFSSVPSGGNGYCHCLCLSFFDIIICFNFLFWGLKVYVPLPWHFYFCFQFSLSSAFILCRSVLFVLNSSVSQLAVYLFHIFNHLWNLYYQVKTMNVIFTTMKINMTITLTTMTTTIRRT